MLLWSPFARAASSWVDVDGLAGVEVEVALAVDPSREATLADMEVRAFTPLAGSIREAGGRDPLWLRIDVSVPSALVGTRAWLDVEPAHLWKLTLHGPDGRQQLSGFGVPVSERTHFALNGRFEVPLASTHTRLYLQMFATEPRVASLALRSEAALARIAPREEWLSGLFFGAALLMSAVSLLYWASTRARIFRAHALYVGTTALFLLFLEGYVTAYVLGDSPRLATALMLVVGGAEIAATAQFGRFFLGLPRRLPSVNRALRGLSLLALVTSLFAVHLQIVPEVAAALITMRAVLVLTLVVSGFLVALRVRTVSAVLAGTTFLLYALIESVPTLTVAGLLTARASTFEPAKLAVVFQMLMTHVLMVARFRVHQRARAERERAALRAGTEAEAARRQREEMGQFLAMFAHEVRTPLSVIDSAAQNLGLLPGAERPEVARRHGHIREAAARLSRLAEVALARERFESGLNAPNIETLPLDRVLGEALAPHGRPAAEMAWADRSEWPLVVGGSPAGALELTLPDPLPVIRADAHLFVIALNNLLDNARKYADAGSTVRLRVDQTRGVVSAMHVESRGPTLTVQELDHVFDKYWRRDEHGDIEGAGLGLHLVRRIAERHGGRAEARDLGDRWTRFSIVLTTSQEGLHS